MKMSHSKGLLKLEVFAIVMIFLAEAWLNNAEANDGFFVMVGAGYNTTLFNDYNHGHGNWQNGDELGTDLGFGYRWQYYEEGVTVDIKRS